MCKIVVADEALMDEDLVQLVNDGKIPATLVDDYFYRAMKASVAEGCGQRRCGGEPGRNSCVGGAQGFTAVDARS